MKYQTVVSTDEIVTRRKGRHKQSGFEVDEISSGQEIEGNRFNRMQRLWEEGGSCSCS